MIRRRQVEQTSVLAEAADDHDAHAWCRIPIHISPPVSGRQPYGRTASSAAEARSHPRPDGSAAKPTRPSSVRTATGRRPIRESGYDGRRHLPPGVRNGQWASHLSWESSSWEGPAWALHADRLVSARVGFPGVPADFPRELSIPLRHGRQEQQIAEKSGTAPSLAFLDHPYCGLSQVFSKIFLLYV